MTKPKFSERMLLNIIFAIALIVILTTNFYSYHQIDKLMESNQWVKHTHQAMEAVNNILLDITGVESVTRAYVISGDMIYVTNIDEKINKTFTDFSLAKKITADNPQQQILIEKLEPLLKYRILKIKETIKLKQENKLQYNIALPLIHEAQNLADRIKETINEMYENEVGLLQQREETFLRNFNFTNTLSFTVDIINLSLLLFIILYFNKMFSSLTASQNQAKQSEALLKGIIGGSKEFIAALDLNFNILTFNDAFQREVHTIFGKKIAVGMNFIEVLSHLPLEQNKVKSIWGRALKGEEFTVIEEFGSNELLQNQYEITYSSIYNDQKQLTGASVIARNIGKRLEEGRRLKESNAKLERTLHQMKNQSKEMEIINDMNDKLRSSGSMKETLSMAFLYLKKILPFSSGIIYLMNHSKNYLESVAEWNEPNVTENIFTPDQCWGLRQGKIYFYINKDESIACKHAEGENPLRSYVCMPLLALNEVVGVLHLQITNSRDMDQSEIIKLYENKNLMIQNIAGQISLSISNIKLYEVLKQRSTRDLLTSLYNRSYLSDTFERDVERAKRNNTPIVVIMMDLDFFKNVNDTYGHEAGDIVLREVSKLLIHELRKSDIACRYGGEEFLIILYDTVFQDASERIEQLRQKISNLQFHFVALLSITASFGVAMFPEDGNNSEELIKAADQALYVSKKTGRNKVTIYNNTLGP